MKKYLKKIYHKEMFHPVFIGLFFNPCFISRRALYKGIKENASVLKGKLLDFGCGNKPYEGLFNVEEYIGLDTEKSGHSHENEDIDVYYDGEKIPFEDHSFDSIFSSQVFEHIFELDKSLKEIHRVCKPNGQLLITVPFVWDEHEIPYDFTRYASFGIKQLLEKHHFKIIKHIKTTNYIETLFQMWIIYVCQYVFRLKITKVLFAPIFMFLTTTIAIILSKILPKNSGFFHDNIVLAEKK